jgi:hypothetical protein
MFRPGITLRRARKLVEKDLAKKWPIFQVGPGHARSLVSLGLERCAGRIEAIVHAEVMSSVSWQAHIPPLLVQTQSPVSAERAVDT